MSSNMIFFFFEELTHGLFSLGPNLQPINLVVKEITYPLGKAHENVFSMVGHFAKKKMAAVGIKIL